MTIRQIIETAGISQCAAARLLSVNPRTMRRWCAGQEPPPMAIMALKSLLTKKVKGIK